MFSHHRFFVFSLDNAAAKRRWPCSQDGDRKSSSSPPAKKSVALYGPDSPRSEPGFSGRLGADDTEAGESLCSYDPDCSLAPPGANGPPYFALMESPTNRELDLSLTWTRQAKGHGAFFHQDEHADAFGLKMIGVTGAISAADCPLSDGSISAFEYEDDGDGDAMNFAHYRDPSGRPQLGGGRGGKRYACAVCSKTYATTQNLEVHLRIHTGQRPFCCAQCGKKFTQSAHLKSHLSVHSGARPYACSLCARSFIVKYSLKLHMKKCHGGALCD